MDVKLMIMDACVLIDYVKADRYILELITKYVGPVFLVSPVVDEVKNINESDLSELGLIIIEPELVDVFDAAAGTGRTSFQDKLCLLTAKRRGLVCVTNDKVLRKACENEGVEYLWGLQLLLVLHENGGIPVEDAYKIVDLIHRNNPKHITRAIVDQFKIKLKTVED